MPPELQQLIDRTQIVDLSLGYARGLDLQDWPLVRACLADEVATDFSESLGFPPMLVRADVIVEHMKVAQVGIKSFHVTTNHHIQFSGPTEALSSAYIIAPNRRYIDGRPVNYDVLGWVEQRVRKIDTSWKIVGLKVRILWEEGDPSILGIDRPLKI